MLYGIEVSLLKNHKLSPYSLLLTAVMTLFNTKCKHFVHAATFYLPWCVISGLRSVNLVSNEYMIDCMYICMLFCLQYCKSKEKKISTDTYLKEKSLDLFDQFISVAEHEIVNRFVLFDNTHFCVWIVYILQLFKFIYVC